MPTNFRETWDTVLNKKLLILFGIIVALYLAISFGTPVNPNILERYRMDAFEYQTMRAALAVPLIAVWFAALYGFSYLLDYARRIKDSPDGQGFFWVAVGLGVMAFGLPVNSVLGLMASRAVSLELISQPASTILTTHLSVGYQLASFALIAFGAWKLLHVLKKVKIPRRNIVVGATILVLISAFYTITALNNPSREVAVPPAVTATYYINDVLIFTTIIVPYLIAWICGVFAFIAMRAYQSNIEGVLYKKALSKLNFGILFIIGISVVLQFLTAAITALYAWQLGSLVVMLQFLIFAIGAGFVYVAIGAKRLTKLEDSK